MNDGREYPSRPLVGIGIVVLKPDAVLLVRRSHPPNQDRWTFPGGAQELGESAEEGARRELAEETGLSVGALQLVGHFDSIHRDRAGRVRFHYTILDFAARYERGSSTPLSDAKETAWATFDHLEPFNLSPQAMAMIDRARTLLG